MGGCGFGGFGGEVVVGFVLGIVDVLYCIVVMMLGVGGGFFTCFFLFFFFDLGVQGGPWKKYLYLK